MKILWGNLFDFEYSKILKFQVSISTSTITSKITLGVVDENELTDILISLGTRVIKGVDIEKLSRGSCGYCKKSIIVDVTESRK